MSPAGRNTIDGKELSDGKVPGKRLWKDFLFSLCCWWLGLAGMYLMALGAAVALVGRGRAMDAGGASRTVVTLGSENLLAAVGKRGLPGSGVGAWALAGATLVRRTLELRLRLACLALLTPGIPGVFA